MNIKIRNVARCREGARGCLRSGKKKGDYLLEISKEQNGTVTAYAKTLLHELLHVFFLGLRRYDVVLTEAEEHKAIADLFKGVLNG